MAAKITVYQEHQGQGSQHADPVTGMCWCAGNPNTKVILYLKAKSKEEAIKEAAQEFHVTAEEIEV